MDKVIQQLEEFVHEANNLIKELKAGYDGNLLQEFSSLCGEYVEIRSTLRIIESIQGGCMEELDGRELKSITEERSHKEEEIRDLQQKSINIIETPDKLNMLIQKGKRILENIKNSSDNGGGMNYQSLIEICEEELKHIEALTEEREWFGDAYQKLSEFSDMEIEGNCIIIKKRYRVIFREGGIEMKPNDFFIVDLDGRDKKFCLSVIQERIHGRDELIKISKQLKWNFKDNKDSPTVVLTPPMCRKGAVFALIGYENYPLIEWGDVDSFKFNSDSESLADRLIRYGREAKYIT